MRRNDQSSIINPKLLTINPKLIKKMILYTFLYLLLGFNLINVIADKGRVVYKDGRFWLVLLSLVVLTVMTACALDLIS